MKKVRERERERIRTHLPARSHVDQSAAVALVDIAENVLKAELASKLRSTLGKVRIERERWGLARSVASAHLVAESVEEVHFLLKHVGEALVGLEFCCEEL